MSASGLRHVGSLLLSSWDLCPGAASDYELHLHLSTFCFNKLSPVLETFTVRVSACPSTQSGDDQSAFSFFFRFFGFCPTPLL